MLHNAHHQPFDDGSDISAQKRRRIDSQKNPMTSNSRHQASSANRNSTDDFHPGSLVSIEMTDFLTYDQVKYTFGPDMNMIIGPNGSGKSAVVCAICIGLGYSPTVCY